MTVETSSSVQSAGSLAVGGTAACWRAAVSKIRSGEAVLPGEEAAGAGSASRRTEACPGEAAMVQAIAATATRPAAGTRQDVTEG